MNRLIFKLARALAPQVAQATDPDQWLVAFTSALQAEADIQEAAYQPHKGASGVFKDITGRRYRLDHGHRALLGMPRDRGSAKAFRATPILNTLPDTESGLHTKAAEIAHHQYAKTAKLLAAYRKPADWLRGKTTQVKAKLVQKYGVKGAAAIIGAGQVITWGITIGAPIMTGLPIIVPPGGGLATSLVLAGLVEAYRKIRGIKGKTDVPESQESEQGLPTQEVYKIAAEVVNGLIAGTHMVLNGADVQESLYNQRLLSVMSIYEAKTPIPEAPRLRHKRHMSIERYPDGSIRKITSWGE